MKKKLTKIIGVALAAVFSLSLFAGCDLISTNNEADMQQVVAEVNIGEDTDSLNTTMDMLGSSLSEEVSSKMNDILSTDEIYKRDLIAYFLSYGYNYLQSNNNYAATFEQIMDELVQRKVYVQFATLYYLSEGEVRVDRDFIDFRKGYTEDSSSDALTMNGDISVDAYLSALDAANVEGASSDQIALAGLGLFLTEEEKNYAAYQVMQAINSSIDSYEQDIIAADSDSTSSEEARTTPTGANEVDAFYPTDENGNLDYGVYTGFNSASEWEEYEKVEGSTVVTRKRAYIRFLNALNQNNLLSDADLSSMLYDVTGLAYYELELRSQYELLLINKFNATIALDMSDAYAEENLINKYNSKVATQQSSGAADFVSTMDSVSDSSFVLYSPADRIYGYVYNILLPFDANQSLEVTNLQTVFGSETREYYAARQSLFAGITATDQRETWFTGSEDYSFNAADYGMEKGTAYYDNGKNSTYLFFKDSFVAPGREADGIDRYAGQYPYNGEVVTRSDGTYDLLPNTVETIDDFIAEMENYINFVAGSDITSGSVESGFYQGNLSYDDYLKEFGSSDNDINYAQMIYYKGKAEIGYTKENAQSFAANYMVKTGEQSTPYRVLSAVNELMFAYSTDTGCLNSYLGYSIASKESATDYVKEFEYAAQDAITNGGPGTYYVVATDYGWHILYVSFVYTGGDTYAGFNYGTRTQENTFSYFFYQAEKTSMAQEYSQEMLSVIFNRLDQVVTRYEDRYSDLTSIGA